MRLGLGAGKTCQRLWEAIPQAYRQGHCKTRLFESVRFYHPRGAAYSRGQRDGRNRPCRALE